MNQPAVAASQLAKVTGQASKVTDIATKAKPQYEVITPTEIGQLSFCHTLFILGRKLPPQFLRDKKKGGRKITFIPWYSVVKILNKYCPGWCYEVKEKVFSDDRIYVTVRLTLTCSDGTVYREATGTEELKAFDKETGEEKEIAYGDPSSNAEAMGLRRAASKFGLALYLWEK